MQVKQHHILTFFFLILLSACEPVDKEHGDVQIAEPDETMQAEWVSYGNFTGYLVKPMGEGRFPGVVMIHEWWGLNQNIKNMAHDLAEEGYIVLAVDLYAGKVADNPNDARTYSSEVRNNMDNSINHLKSAVSFLRNQNVNGLASIGWCFGGGMSMQLSLNENLNATVIYYGNLETDVQKLQSIQSPVLGIFGEKDAVIPIDSVHQFDEALDTLGIENEIYVYDLGHAFANPSNPGHDPKSTEDAWMKTVDFLNKHLK